MTLNREKLGHAVTFMKYLSGIVSLILLPKIISGIKFPQSSRADGKLTYEKCL